VWADEFDGTSVDTTKWNVRNNWAAKNEIAIDTNRPANVFVSNGVLTIRSLREQRTIGSATRQFTSGYLDTIGKQSWTYGRFSMRAQLATQQGISKGIWPAFWMRPDDGGVGEIDIMEAIGSDATGTEWNKTHQTIHHDYTVTVPAQAHTTTSPAGGSPSDGFHTYTVDWLPGAMIWSIDGTEVWRRDRTTTPWFDQAFARPFNIRLNQQVGGTWAGTPTAATAFPADYKVDWVRVYQKS
jgi:beta-glucanase (GH16 family)